MFTLWLRGANEMKWRIVAEARWWHFVLLVGVLLLAGTGWARSQQLQKPDQVVRKIRVVVLYRSKDCIVSRVTVFEPEPWRAAVTEFYVVEGGVNFDRPIPPKCKVEVMP